MHRLTVAKTMYDEDAAKLKGTFLGPDSYDHLVKEATEVYREDGSLLLKYIPACIPAALCAKAWPALRKVGGGVTNRGTAAGVKATNPLTADGYRSQTTRVPKAPELDGVQSSIVGAFERNSVRFPVCRLTAFNLERPDLFAEAVPFFQAIDRVFKREVPGRWRAQMERIEHTHPAWVIHGTSFTTVTVNKDFRTAVHTDKGDLRDGFGVLSALRAGRYTGCYLVFPQYRVAVDLRTRGVLLADVHEWHGNTELVGHPGQYERISCVLYYRSKMERCKSPEEEVEWGKRRQPGDPIWPLESGQKASSES